MCQHQPPCPAADASDAQAARAIAAFPDQGWSLLCNGTIAFDDGGALTVAADGRTTAVPPAPITRPQRAGR